METQKVEVTVRQGVLRGVVTENAAGGNYFAFRGIPYAQPPVGELRFKDPVPPKPWTGVRDASKFGDKCAHKDQLARQIIGSDDCLYLNVYTTDIKPPVKRAVMVWIHGGAFIYGSGNDDMYGPDFIVKKDVVLVTINYRLGVLGFLNLEDEVAPGNQGLKDQVMALRWVQENISNFGGDPNNVTIFGESAGGASVHYLTLSPMATGLFHKAIAQSGVATCTWASYPREPRRVAFQLSALLGKKSFDPKVVVEFLRTIDPVKLVEVQTSLTTEEEDVQLCVPFGPGPDYKSPNPFLPYPPTEAMRAGIKVPLLIGYNSDEGIFFTRMKDEMFEQLNQNLEPFLHPLTLETLKQEQVSPSELRRMYFGDGPVTKEKYAVLVGDTHFCRDIHEVVNVQTEKNLAPTYLYKFSYDNGNSFAKTVLNVELPVLPGTGHAEDLMYMFYPHLMKEFGFDMHEEGSTERRVIEYFVQMWTDFAKTGNPTPKKTELIPVLWQPLKEGDTLDYLLIGEHLRMEKLRKGEQRFDWKNVKNKL